MTIPVPQTTTQHNTTQPILTQKPYTLDHATQHYIRRAHIQHGQTHCTDYIVLHFGSLKTQAFFKDHRVSEGDQTCTFTHLVELQEAVALSVGSWLKACDLW